LVGNSNNIVADRRISLATFTLGRHAVPAMWRKLAAASSGPIAHPGRRRPPRRPPPDLAQDALESGLLVRIAPPMLPQGRRSRSASPRPRLSKLGGFAEVQANFHRGHHNETLFTSLAYVRPSQRLLLGLFAMVLAILKPRTNKGIRQAPNFTIRPRNGIWDVEQLPYGTNRRG
jgi:hypothetical protein